MIRVFILRLTFSGKEFILSCSYEQRHIPKSYGFKWHEYLKHWYTESLWAAFRLRDFADPEARKIFDQKEIKVTPWLGKLPPGYSNLKKHQTEGVDFVLGRNHSYLWYDPGTGKTPIAASVAWAHSYMECGLFSCVYISPPFLVRNVKREFETWAPGLKVEIMSSRRVVDPSINWAQVLIFPDSLIGSVWAKPLIKTFLGSMPTTLLIVDEAHRFKNEQAKRTISLFGRKGIANLFTNTLCMSGTPTPNRRIELFTVLNCLAPQTIEYRNYKEFGMHYCDGKDTAMGWDFTGVSNSEEFWNGLKIYMKRAEKSVLNLPPKIEEVFFLSDNAPSQTAPFEKAVMKKFKNDDQDMLSKLVKLNGLDAEDLQQISVYRRVLGEYKARDILPYIKSILDDTNDNLIIFAYHSEAIKILSLGLKDYKHFVITGDTPEKLRDHYVESFRKDDSVRVVIGNYIAMGVGFPMQKADRVVFVEFSWVPGENAQASDRPHRIGRTGSVLVQYVTYQGSLDEAVIRTNLKKIALTNTKGVL